MGLPFIDWKKDFDRVYWTKLLRNIGVNWRERLLSRILYIGQNLKLHLNQGETDKVRLEEDSDRDVVCHLYLTYIENI